MLHLTSKRRSSIYNLIRAHKTHKRVNYFRYNISVSNSGYLFSPPESDGELME